MSLENYIARQRLGVAAFGKLFSFFAATGLVLARVGLYAAVARAVSRRTREIGIRVAILGNAQRHFQPCRETGNAAGTARFRCRASAGPAGLRAA